MEYINGFKNLTTKSLKFLVNRSFFREQPLDLFLSCPLLGKFYVINIFCALPLE